MERGSTSLEPYLAGLRERVAAEQGRAQVRMMALRGRLPRVVEHLVKNYRVHRIVLFGSLARGEASERSDVDLLVYGLPEMELLRATSEVERLLEEATVDLVPAEIAYAHIRERAESEGEVLFEGSHA